jgi:hypothetical protein
MQCDLCAWRCICLSVSMSIVKEACLSSYGVSSDWLIDIERDVSWCLSRWNESLFSSFSFFLCNMRFFLFFSHTSFVFCFSFSDSFSSIYLSASHRLGVHIVLQVLLLHSIASPVCRSSLEDHIQKVVVLRLCHFQSRLLLWMCNTLNAGLPFRSCSKRSYQPLPRSQLME